MLRLEGEERGFLGCFAGLSKLEELRGHVSAASDEGREIYGQQGGRLGLEALAFTSGCRVVCAWTDAPGSSSLVWRMSSSRVRTDGQADKTVLLAPIWSLSFGGDMKCWGLIIECVLRGKLAAGWLQMS